MKEYKELIKRANDLVDAIYANIQSGYFKADTENNETIGSFIVAIHIREEAMDLEELLDNIEKKAPNDS